MDKDISKVEFPISREALYDLAWSEPMTSIGKRMDVSSSYLARVFTRLNIPRPPVGYWAKIEAGKTVPKPPLPDINPGEDDSWDRYNDAPLMKPVRQTQDIKPRKTARKRKSVNETHRLIRGAKAHFLKTRDLNNGYLKPYKKMLVDLIVSKENLDAALNAANQIFLALEDFDHHVAFEGRSFRYQRVNAEDSIIKKEAKEYLNLWGPDRCTIASVGSIPIGLTVYEEGKVIDVQYVDGDYLPVEHPKAIKYASRNYSWTTTKLYPSGKFVLFAYSPIYRVKWTKQWSIPDKTDLKRFGHKVAKELNEHAVELLALQTQAEAEEERERREWDERQRKWEIEERERKKQKAISDSTKQLNLIIDRWAEKKKIQNFFDQLEQDIETETAEPGRRVKLLERLDEARKLAQPEDPLELLSKWKGPDEIIQET